MRSLPRIVWEILVLVVLAAVGWGLYTWTERDWRDRLAAAEESRRSELAEVRRDRAASEGRQMLREAEAVARAFASGIQSQALAGRYEAVENAVGQLLLLPRVVFVHVLAPDGAVLASSDRKLVATGEAGPRAEWALGAGELATRPELETGVTEVAVPLRGVSGPGAILWMAYETADRGPEAGADEPQVTGTPG